MPLLLPFYFSLFPQLVSDMKNLPLPAALRGVQCIQRFYKRFDHTEMADCPLITQCAGPEEVDSLLLRQWANGIGMKEKATAPKLTSGMNIHDPWASDGEDEFRPQGWSLPVHLYQTLGSGSGSAGSGGASAAAPLTKATVVKQPAVTRVFKIETVYEFNVFGLGIWDSKCSDWVVGGGIGYRGRAGLVNCAPERRGQ